MIEIKFTTEAANYIAEQEIVETHIKRAERAIKKQREQELISEGVDKEVAKVMAQCGL